jgi:GT2 family glycosyltransferase
LILNGKNLGFGRANNIGLQIALQERADFVYLLNQDAWVEETTFEVLIEALRRHSEFCLMSPWQVFPDRNTEYWFDVFFQNREHSQVDYPEEGIFQSDSPAAHWMLSRECIEKVGGFSPSFHHYGEDENYMQRIKWHGMKAGVCRSAIAVHDTGVREQSLEQKFYREYVAEIVKFSNPGNTSSRILILWDYFIFALRSAKQYKTFMPIRYFLRFVFSSRKMYESLECSKSKCAFLTSDSAKQ